MTTRREFLETTAAAAGALGLGLTACANQPASLRILILGGTGFIGPHMVRYAQSRGHTITLFNRGRTNTDLFPEVEKLVGDRDGNLTALEGGQWDVVIDNSGFVPRHVRDSAQLLKDAARQYIFVSSISAYVDLTTPNITESYAVGTLDDPTVEQVTGQTYGPLKALCEQAAQEAFPDGANIIRPGYIVGPRDNSDRWTYWPVRVDRGGEMLAPGKPDDPTQFIDARDLAAFAVHSAEQMTTGVFNLVGPAVPMPMGEMLESMASVTGSGVTYTWVNAEFLEEQGVVLPIWSPTTGPLGGVHQVSNVAAVAAGLTYRPASETIADTLEWWKSLDEERRNGMTSGLRQPPDLGFGPASIETQIEQEAKILEMWRAA